MSPCGKAAEKVSNQKFRFIRNPAKDRCNTNYDIVSDKSDYWPTVPYSRRTGKDKVTLFVLTDIPINIMIYLSKCKKFTGSIM